MYKEAKKKRSHLFRFNVSSGHNGRGNPTNKMSRGAKTSLGRRRTSPDKEAWRSLSLRRRDWCMLFVFYQSSCHQAVPPRSSPVRIFA
jgi:hypothetical protein